MFDLLLLLPSSDAACRTSATAHRYPTLLGSPESPAPASVPSSPPRCREPLPHRAPEGVDRTILTPFTVPNPRPPSGGHDALAVVFWDDALLPVSLRQPLVCDRATPARAVRPSRSPESPRARTCRARVFAPHGGPELCALRASRLAWERRGNTPGRFRPMFATHDSIFKSWVPFVSAHFATHPTRLRGSRFHAGMPLRRARLHQRAFLPAASVGAYL